MCGSWSVSWVTRKCIHSLSSVHHLVHTWRKCKECLCVPDLTTDGINFIFVSSSISLPCCVPHLSNCCAVTMYVDFFISVSSNWVFILFCCYVSHAPFVNSSLYFDVCSFNFALGICLVLSSLCLPYSVVVNNNCYITQINIT